MSVIIGISLGYTTYEEKLLTINKNYAQVVKEAGAIPFLLPPFIERKKFNELPVDGIILSGGGDIDPRYFGENPQQGIRRIDPVRDKFEIKLCRWAVKTGIPILAICRGIQVLNIACGGTIIQNLSDSCIKHEQESPRWHPSHKIKINENSLLFNIFSKKVINVNSFHHQAVEKTGQGLEVAARAPDGIVEAVVGDKSSFVLGVQWHPELMYRKIKVHFNIFKTFIKNC